MVQSEVTGRGIRDPQVVRAMAEVPRHLFVPARQRQYAYYDAALPLGYGQTITSPYVVAFMTEQLEPQPTDRILEIGTGSGYQAAILSRIVAEVYSIEIVEPLGKRAARTISQLGYENVHTKIGDGYQGWPEHAPFDKIIVTCSPEKVPPALVAQLKEGGRLVVPLGQRFQQTLFLFRKVGGKLEKEKLEATFFVPMTGQAEQLRVKKDDSGWPELVNGGFEDLAADGEPVGWFYLRRAKVIPEPSAPEGQHVLTLSNAAAGQHSHAIQAFGIDGRVVGSLDLSAHVRISNIGGVTNRKMLPKVEISFYDENRGSIRTAGLGPWQQDSAWKHHRIEIPVPGRARLATIAVGMFGATGQAEFDQITVRGRAKRP
jgi:protein-L-isoaspartate(D-aspartate) O-methyltransferase